MDRESSKGREARKSAEEKGSKSLFGCAMRRKADVPTLPSHPSTKQASSSTIISSSPAACSLATSFSFPFLFPFSTAGSLTDSGKIRNVGGSHPSPPFPPLLRRLDRAPARASALGSAPGLPARRREKDSWEAISRSSAGVMAPLGRIPRLLKASGPPGGGRTRFGAVPPGTVEAAGEAARDWGELFPDCRLES